METFEELRTAKDVIQALLKAKKMIRMYPENNPVYRKTMDEAFAKFTELFNYKDELDLKIKQNEIFFDSEQIYFNPEKEDNLALFFFKDGLRELSFKKGLDESELEEFLKIVALDFDREAVDDDIVTLLWEKDFQNIKYVADEAFLMEDEDYESQAVTEVKKKAAGTDEVLKAYAAAFDSEDVKDIAIINLSDKDLHLLVKEIDKDSQDKTLKIYDILFEMLFQAENVPEYEDVLRLLREVFLYCIRHEDLKIVVDVMKKTRELAENPSTSDKLKGHLKHLLSSANSEEAIKGLGGIFDSDIDIDEAVLNEYISFLDKTAIPPLLSILGEAESLRGRKVIINVLINLGKMDIQAVAKGLHDDRWYVVRNIIYILRQIGDKKAVEHLLSTAKHSDERVRKESIKALGELKSPLALQTLKDCLNDADVSIRKAAAKALGSIGSETAKRLILERVSGKDFRDGEFDEKKEFFEVLARWNDAGMIDFMMKILKRTSLFKKAKMDEDRACAAYSLGLMGCRDCLELLHKLRDSKNRLLREHVNAAIKKIEYGG